MPFQKVEYEFPDGETEEKQDIEVEGSGAIEVDIGGKKAKAAAKKSESVVESEVDTDDDEYEVEVVDDTPKADRNRKASDPPEDITDDELEDYSEKVRKRIQHFSKGYHDERRAKEVAFREREELERLSQQLVEENKKLKSNVNKNQTALLEQAKRSVVTDVESAKKKYKDAYEAGDPDGILAAQESLTNAKIKADRLNNFKLPALQEDETNVNMVSETTPPPVKVDKRAQAWQDANDWFNQDVEMTSYALGLHNKLVNEGVNPQSDDYYERIDSRMRQLFPENFEGEEVEKPRKRSNVVAPATRSTASKKVRLTQTQYRLSKRLGLTPEQYAKQVALDMRKQ
jgi:Pyruvate/2-oxoacid:ferredoxin oxidoreductase gamma subunit|tara:strand:- start:390 stop:1418 length:1029 start_codon:yes stop_codon:yes gene_type:complete